jgi:hypothetical protein
MRVFTRPVLVGHLVSTDILFFNRVVLLLVQFFLEQGMALERCPNATESPQTA